MSKVKLLIEVTEDDKLNLDLHGKMDQVAYAVIQCMEESKEFENFVLGIAEAYTSEM